MQKVKLQFFYSSHFLDKSVLILIWMLGGRGENRSSPSSTSRLRPTERVQEWICRHSNDCSLGQFTWKRRVSKDCGAHSWPESPDAFKTVDGHESVGHAGVAKVSRLVTSFDYGEGQKYAASDRPRSRAYHQILRRRWLSWA